jgi:hypothetical protein
MLSTLRSAVDSNIGGGPAAGAVCVARSFLDFDLFLVAMMNPLGGRPLLRPDLDASLSKLIFDRAPLSHAARAECLKRLVNRE